MSPLRKVWFRFVKTRTEAKSTEYAHFGAVEKVKNINFAFSEWTQIELSERLEQLELKNAEFEVLKKKVQQLEDKK
jgi:hypothetical protein